MITHHYAKNSVTNACAVLLSDKFLDPEEGGQKYFDIDSFVEWFLINEQLPERSAIHEIMDSETI